MSKFTSEVTVEAPRRFAVVDLTQEVESLLRTSRIREGLVNIFCRHTTCGVIINELEDGLSEDLAWTLNHLVPDGYYAHDDLSRRTQNLQGPNEPANGSAHVRQILLNPTSQTVPVADGQLLLGRWQRILFLELDHPRPRGIYVSILGA
ncbi:MAG TPA: secondary thiamine-phosphate synthase enzyme YjbQ [Actinomycetota bacterium]|nr:secondary thiamine-phosphate synthase enzyme YjbQ [Actinomycetota bacterium]